MTSIFQNISKKTILMSTLIIVAILIAIAVNNYYADKKEQEAIARSINEINLIFRYFFQDYSSKKHDN